MSHEIVKSENMGTGRVLRSPNARPPRKYYAMADGSPVRDFLDPAEFNRALASGAIIQVAAPVQEAPKPEPVEQVVPTAVVPPRTKPTILSQDRLPPEGILSDLANSCKVNNAYLVDQNGTKITNISIKYLAPEREGVSFE